MSKSKSSKRKGAYMLKNLVTIFVIGLAVIGGINVYNSSSFQNLKETIINHEAVKTAGEVIGEVTHTDSTK